MGSDGTIAAQGTFDELNSEGGYLRPFALEHTDRQSSKKSDISFEERRGIPEDTVTSPAQTVGDKARQLGDWTVYKYYFRSIGFANTATFFALQLIWVVLLKFPGTYFTPVACFVTDHRRIRNLAGMVGRRQCGKSKSAGWEVSRSICRFSSPRTRGPCGCMQVICSKKTLSELVLMVLNWPLDTFS
jgi:hypothetical protein